MHVLRWIGAVLLLPVALFAFLGAAWSGQGAESSLANSQDLLADLRQMGEFTEARRAETGFPPNTEELKAWIAQNDFRTARLDNYEGDMETTTLSIGVLPAGESFILGEPIDLPQDGHSYYLAYWSNRTSEYAPETGANDLPSSVADYAAAPWKRVLLGLLGLGLAILIIHLVRPSTFRRSAS